MTTSTIPAALATVRRAAAADAPALLAMLETFQRHEGIPWRPDAVAPALAALISDAELGFVLVADDGADLAGYLMATAGFDLEFAGHDGWITDVYVRPRARRAGVAEVLLAAGEREATRLGWRALHLQVRPENGDALPLYRRRGFAEVPRLILSKLLEP